MGSDLRSAFRHLGARPLFTALSAMGLALGLGAAGAAFAIVNAALLNPPPSFAPAPSLAPILWTLLAEALSVLVLACANLVNLLLAHGARRRREMAVRRAIGASRARVAAQVLTESVLLALAGGAGSLIVALWGIDLLRTGLSDLIPASLPIGIDVTVATWLAVVSVVAGVAIGLIPACDAAAPGLRDSLADGDRLMGPTRRHHRVGAFLVVLEVALALVMLSGAGLRDPFGLATVLLAATGVYGVVAYAVAERARELALKITLGARPGDVIRQAAGRVWPAVTGGLIVGVAGLIALPFLIDAPIHAGAHGVPAAVAATLLAAVALVATYLPARRALRGEPMDTLRSPS